MSKITTITRADCATIRDAVAAALVSVEKQFGLKLSTKGGKFGPTSFTLPIEFATVSTDGAVNSVEATNFTRMSNHYGVDPSMLNKKITTDSGTYTLTGLNPRSRRFPFTAVREDGKGFKLGANTVKFAIANAAITPEHVRGALHHMNKLTAQAFEPGCAVRVKWTDGLWYDAAYVRPIDGKHAVVFEDGSRFRAEAIKRKSKSKSTDTAML
jgi:hypothetical protein